MNSNTSPEDWLTKTIVDFVLYKGPVGIERIADHVRSEAKARVRDLALKGTLNIDRQWNLVVNRPSLPEEPK